MAGFPAAPCSRQAAWNGVCGSATPSIAHQERISSSVTLTSPPAAAADHLLALSALPSPPDCPSSPASRWVVADRALRRGGLPWRQCSSRHCSRFCRPLAADLPCHRISRIYTMGGGESTAGLVWHSRMPCAAGAAAAEALPARCPPPACLVVCVPHLALTLGGTWYDAGNAQKSATARARNLEKNKKAAGAAAVGRRGACRPAGWAGLE